jgi:cell division protein FtsQ
VAALGFMAAAGIYGVSVGDYIGRSADYATKKISTIIVSVGFAVNQVTIEGQNRSTNEEIMNALGLDRSTSTLAFNTAEAQKRLEKLPMVRRAQVMRLLPSQLHVVLEERVPYAVWQYRSALHLVDQDGMVIENLKQRTHPKLSLVVGAGAAKHARELLSELSQWPEVKAKVQAIVRVADRRWNLKLHNGMEIRLPERGEARALKKVAELDRKHAILSGDAILLDLRLSDRVTIRLSEDAASRRDSVFVAPARKARRPGQDT